MAASGPIQPSKLRANWCNVSARLFLECLDFWKWRVVCLGCFVHLCSPYISSKLSFNDWYWLIGTQESLLIIYRHSTWPTCTPAAFMVPLGHFGPLVVKIAHTRHRSNIFHLVPKLVSKLGKMVDLFSNCNQLQGKHHPHTLPRNTSSIVAVSQHLVKSNQLQEPSIRFW